MKKETASKISKIKIENFQSHENTVLDFYDGLNVIVGPSDQGKSAVIRAMKWVLYNEPRGMEFIRQGASFARVTVEMSTGYTIIRERSKSKNRYAVIDPNGEESIYEGFGNDIPKEVISAHGIPKVILDTDISSSLNIGEQLEGPFLLSETGATRAKAIGRLTGTHIIDNAIRDSMTDLRRENQTSDRLDKELQAIGTKLEEYKELDEIKERLDASEALIAKLQLKLDRLQSLTKIVERLEMLKNECLKAEHEIERLRDVDKCGNILNKIQMSKERFTKLNQISSDIYAVDNEKEDAVKILENTEKTDELLKNVRTAEVLFKKYDSLVSTREKYAFCKKEIGKIEKYTESFKEIDKGIQSLNILEKSFGRLGKLLEVRDQYDAICDFISEGIKYSENNKQQIKKYVNEYTETLKKAGKCPTCGNEISELKVEEILKHYEETNL